MNDEYKIMFPLYFKSEEDKQRFIGLYLDAGGEQSIGVYAARLTKVKKDPKLGMTDF